MAYWLLPVFVLSLGFLAYFGLRGSASSRVLPGGVTAGQVDKAVTLAYLCLSAACIAGILISHIALPGPAVERAARHFEFRGVAVTVPSASGDTSNVRITGDPVDAESEVQRAFRWFALPSGSWIDLRPEALDGDRIVSYRAQARNLGDIARLNGMCINQAVGGWVAQDAVGDYRISSQSHTVDVALVAKKSGVAVKSGASSSDVVPVVGNENLRAVLRKAGASKLLNALAPMRDARGVPILDALQVVRRELRNRESDYGIVSAAASAPPPGAETDVGDRHIDVRRLGAAPSSGAGVSARNERFALEVSGASGRFRLDLPTHLQTTVGGQVRLKFTFDPPRSYPLPPIALLREKGDQNGLASADNGQVSDGYVFDTGNLNESFATTGTLSEDGTSLSVANDHEDTSAAVKPNGDRLLGDGSVLAVFALVDPLKGKAGAMVAPILAVGLGWVLCVLGFVTVRGKRGARRPPRDLGAAHPAFVLWVAATALLAVRSVLAFRVSLLPPFNMDAAGSASFRACWPRAWTAIVVIPPVLGALVYLAVRAKGNQSLPAWTTELGRKAGRWLAGFSDRPWLRLGQLCYAAAFCDSLCGFFAKYLHLPIPSYVLLGILLVVLGLALEGVSETRDAEFQKRREPTTFDGRVRDWTEGQKKPVRYAVGFFLRRGWPLAMTALLTFAVDPGTFVFFFPLGISLAVSAVASEFGRSRLGGSRSRLIGAKGALVLAALGFVLGMAVAVPLGEHMLTSPFAAGIVGDSAFPYRLVATDASAAESLLVNPETRAGAFQPHAMQDTLHQRWEMRTYVKAAPVGYFGTPLSKVGMTYPTMLSDAVFSVFLVGEHGRVAGAAAIGLALLIALALFRQAWNAARSRHQRSNARGLYAIGAVIGGSAVYMSLANLWVIPFTGQNMPLLSLDSREDLLLNGTMLVAALLLIAFPSTNGQSLDREAASEAAGNRIWWWGYPAALVLGWAAMGWSLFRDTGPSTQPFNFSHETIAAVQERVDRAVAESAGGRIPLTETAAVKGSPTFVRQMFEAYARGAVSETPLTSDRSGARLVVDKNHFLVLSPFAKDEGVAWHGELLAQGAVRRRQLIVGGSRVPVILQQGKGVAELTLGRVVRPITAQTIEIRQRVRLRGTATRSVDYGGITLSGEDVILRWRSSGKPGTILINGERPEQKLNEHTLEANDVVSLEYTGADGVAQKLTLTYPGPSEASLAEVSWRNGRFVRTYPQGSDFPLAYTIGEIADADVRAGHKVPNLTLSLNLSLQRDLQELLRSWCRQHGRVVDSGVDALDGLPFTSVTVLDSYTGRIRGLASVPQCDPAEDLNSVKDRFPSERDALVADRSSWAFVNRTIGSTIKPLCFAALNSQLDHDGFDLGTLHVNEIAGVETETDETGKTVRAYRRLGDIELKRGRRLGRENPRADVDMGMYLRDSRTWPAIVSSTIGLVSDRSRPQEQRSELRAMLVPSATGPLTIDGRRVAFLPGAALRRLFAPDGTISSLELDDTAYFQGIQNCFGPGVAPFNAGGMERWDDGLDKTFYAPLDLSASPHQEYRALGLPDVHRADTTNLTNLDGELIRYMIGGGECRWNGLAMATNIARVTTGLKVTPTFNAQAKQTQTPMPAPVKSFKWRRDRIIDPLSNITTIPREYLQRIRSSLPAGYRIAMKTGTIDDGGGKNAMESEMLMFTVGAYIPATGFVPGRSVSGFVSIRSSKKAVGDDMVKGDLVVRAIPIIIAHLNDRG